MGVNIISEPKQTNGKRILPKIPFIIKDGGDCYLVIQVFESNEYKVIDLESGLLLSNITYEKLEDLVDYEASAVVENFDVVLDKEYSVSCYEL